ncbi:MAG: hypothetical protein BWY57_03413 [Betaproteobacteria bacterium ADurb.Bin341]|nr:MAG: hypothetical protein BWY57_03413 [Betaproteobacteria bacterium ADurb.Bin341]
MLEQSTVGIAPVHHRPQRTVRLALGIHVFPQGMEALRTHVGQRHVALGLTVEGMGLLVGVAPWLLRRGGMDKIDGNHPRHPVMGRASHGDLQETLSLDEVNMEWRPQRVARVLDSMRFAPAFAHTRVIHRHHQRPCVIQPFG